MKAIMPPTWKLPTWKLQVSCLCSPKANKTTNANKLQQHTTSKTRNNLIQYNNKNLDKCRLPALPAIASIWSQRAQGFNSRLCFLPPLLQQIVCRTLSGSPSSSTQHPPCSLGKYQHEATRSGASRPTMGTTRQLTQELCTIT